MSYVDIAIIALLVLFALFGVWKGVQKSALSLGAFLVAFVIAFFLSNIVAEAFLNIEGIRNFVMGTGDDGFSLYSAMHEIIGKAAPNDFLLENYFNPITEVIVEYMVKYPAAVTAFDPYALYISFMIFSAICGVGLFIVARALLCIVTMIVKSFIPRKKSLGNRVCGLVVGAVRGAAWTFVITLLFTIIAGLPFAGFTKIEEEYEKGMMGKYVNQYSYVLRNKFFLPDVDMFARIVDKSGLAAEAEEPEEPDELASEKADVKVEFLNLNYPDDAYQKGEDNTIVFNEGAAKINSADYADVEFDEAVAAIVAYNDAIGQRLQATSGNILDGADAATLASLMSSGQSLMQKMYLTDPEAANEDIASFYTSIRNYAAEWNRVKDLQMLDQESVDQANAALQKYYDATVDYLDSIKELYNGITLFTADESIGQFVLPELPQVKTVSLYTGEGETPSGGEDTPSGGDTPSGEEREPAAYKPRYAFAA